MLKKILIGILIAILLIILIPLIIGIANNAEIYELNEEIRAGLYGDFIELSDGWVHYELKGPKEAQPIVLIHGNSSPYFSFDNNVDANCANVFSSTEKLEEFKEKYKLQMQFKGWKRAKLSNIRSMDLEEIINSYKIVGKQERSVLLIWGTDDRLIPEVSMNRMHSVIPGIEYHEIDGAGHVAHYERPEKVNPIMLDFLLH